MSIQFQGSSATPDRSKSSVAREPILNAHLAQVQRSYTISRHMRAQQPIRTKFDRDGVSFGNSHVEGHFVSLGTVAYIAAKISSHKRV